MVSELHSTERNDQGYDWRRGVIYHVYLKSFADGNGDGLGDVAGAIDRLDYITDLGVDTVWVSPWYVSPMADGGYDVADYLTIDPRFGTNDDARRFIDESHRRGVRVLLDLVVNHCSEEHYWFRHACESSPGSPAREWFYFRDGRGAHGELPPTDWVSVFGGPAWTRIVEPSGEPGQWYLHLFDAAQPDLNWYNPEVRNAFDDILRYWFDLGVDGFRLDAVPGIGKDLAFTDVGSDPSSQFAPESSSPMPFWDAGEVHEIVRRWRRVAESYAPAKFLIGEIVVSTPEALVRYVRPDELQSVFAFDLTKSPWSASELRHRIMADLEGVSLEGSWPTWVLSSHDEVRTVTRYGVEDGEFDYVRGLRRARAALMLSLALPGGACIYQGEELGLPQVTDLPREVLEDPIVARTGDPTRGRDGCRVPMPWSDGAPPFGFGSGGSWLPQPVEWGALSVECQDSIESSQLSFVRSLVDTRRALLPTLHDDLVWLDMGDDVVAFTRGGLGFVLNVGDEPVALPEGWRILLSSTRDHHGNVARDQAVWVQLP
jgi:alpha-glucosidase